MPTFLRVLGWLVGALGWLGAGLGSVGGIATIGAALRRVAGVSGVYGRKTPRVVAWLRGCVPVWWLGFAVVSGGVVSGGMSPVSLWLGSSLLVAWGELLP